MFFTPYFGGCKYTNYFLFINKIIVFQHFDLLITSAAHHQKKNGKDWATTDDKVVIIRKILYIWELLIDKKEATGMKE